MFCLLLVSCQTNNSNIDLNVNLDNQDSSAMRLDSTVIDSTEVIDPCDFIYDTITDYEYSMHLGIMEKFNNKDKRGYVYGPNGDTVNHFLYHQDIIAFISKLDSKETGVYKLLTNKVIFLILENDTKMLDYGLTLGPKNEDRLDYFMEHVSHPICNTLNTVDLISLIEKNMSTHNEMAAKIKGRLIQNLEISKN